jgi:hypothetical protein
MTDAERALGRKAFADDPRRASYSWEARKDGLVVRAEWDVLGNEHPLAELVGLAPYEFHAMPYKPDKFKAVKVDILPGMLPVWMHVVNMGLNLFVPTGEDLVACLIFGRQVPLGTTPETYRDDVTIILNDGTMAGFDSIDKAKAVFFDAVAGARAARSVSGDLHGA